MSCFTTVTPPGWQGPADGVPCCWATMAGDDWDVVPQQAAAAARALLHDLATESAA